MRDYKKVATLANFMIKVNFQDFFLLNTVNLAIKQYAISVEINISTGVIMCNGDSTYLTD